MIENTRRTWWGLLLSLAVAFFLVGVTTASRAQSFLRGEANEDLQLDVSDPICLVIYLFTSGETDCHALNCMDALDVNDDGGVDVSDVVSLLSFLFREGSPPPSPGFAFCGPDPTEDLLDCHDYDICEDEFCPLLRVGSVGQQRNPDLVVDRDGNVIAVWESDLDEDGLFEIRGAAYHPDRTERIDPFSVNDTSAGQQFNPAIAVDGMGRFVAVWEDDNNVNQIFQVRARGFNADGTERLAEFTVNENSRGQQMDPDIAMDDAGSFVVVWEDDGNKDGLFEIQARGFNADGTERFAQLTVNESSRGQQMDPAIAMDGSGNFVVVWEDDGNEDGLFNVEARGFNADGTERIAQFTANDRDANQQVNPAIAMDGAGNFIVLWDDDRDGDENFQVHARAFNADGTERISRFTVNVHSAGQQINASVAMNAAGEFAAAWESDRDNDGEFHVRMRGFNADGTQNFAHTKVDCLEPAQHLDPVIGIDGSGRITVFWDETGDSHPPQVLGRTFLGVGSTTP